MSLNCAVKLGIPEIIHNHGGKIFLGELAGATKTPLEKKHALCHLMRLLVITGVFSMKDNIYYQLTPFSKLLIKDKEDNLAPYVVSVLSQFMVKPWHFMSDWSLINSDVKHEGLSFWDVTNEDVELGKMFSEAMPSKSR
ncbi:putative plant methyltransferase dimerization, O-methyltransferase COMT-type [Dioscorea sansibarensis]